MTSQMQRSTRSLAKVTIRLFSVIGAALVCATFGQAQASDWQLSVALGSGQAGDPSNTSGTDIELSADSLIYIVANRFEQTNSDGAHLYSEFLIASSTLSAEVNGGADSYKTDIDATHLQLGGIYEWTNDSIFDPYFAMTIGLSHYSPELTDSETYFSGTAGIGTRIRIIDSLALRLEARALGTLLNTSSTIFCDQEEDCAIGVDGTLWMQQHFTAGMTWSF